MPESLRDFLARHVEAGTMPGAIATLGTGFTPVSVGLTEPGGEPMPIAEYSRTRTARSTTRGPLGAPSPCGTCSPTDLAME